jgi:glycosyltransferase involved in cell wall biosynthesis
MQILIVSPFLPPHVGGTEQHSHQLCKAFIDAGHTVDLISHIKTTTPCNGSFFWVPSIVVMGRLPFPVPASKEFRASLTAIKKKNYDLVVIQSHLFALSVICAHLLPDARKILVGHGSEHVVSKNPVLAKLIVAYELFNFKLIRKAKNISYVGVSAKVCQFLSRLKAEAPTVVPPGVNLSDFPQKQKTEGSSVFKLLFVGRFEHGKGAEDALEVYQSVKLIKPDRHLSLTMIGDGSRLKNVMQKIRSDDQVTCLGKLSRDQVLRQMSQHDLLVCPSDTEGFSFVLLEAGASGMNIVGYDVGGMAEVLPFTDEESRLRHVARDISDLSDKIQFFLDFPQENAARGRQIRQHTLADFNWSKTAAKLIGPSLRSAGRPSL